MKKIAELICPFCNQKIHVIRSSKGRIILTTSLGVILSGIGGVIGAGLGIATGGVGLSASIPLATLGLIIGSGGGFIVGDKLIDKAKCPKCKNNIKIS